VAESDTLAVLAAFIEGDRWLSADAAAVYLGMTTREGQPNRRGFLERVASRSDFPHPLIIGNEKKWRKVELEAWALRRRRHTQPSCRASSEADSL